MQDTAPPTSDTRYAGEAVLFGAAPNRFLASQSARLRRGWSALAVADGEGRNGVRMAEQGLAVLSIDASAVAQAKARRLAVSRRVDLQFELADLETRRFPQATFDVVAGIFIQLEGYRPEQLAYGAGGPRITENLDTEAMLRDAFADFEILELNAYDAVIEEGAGHRGMSALIDLAARAPCPDQNQG